MKTTDRQTTTSRQPEQRHAARLGAFADQVTEIAGRPLDRWQVAAVLESRGVRDVEAAKLGYTDVIDMGRQVFEQAKWAPVRGQATVAAKPGPLKRLIRVFAYYLQGLAFTLPMLGQMVLLLGVGVALFTSTSLSIAQATVISAAALASMIITGGFIQAMARREHFYLSRGEPRLARSIAFRFVLDGVLVGVAVALLVAVLNLITQAVAWPQLRDWASYFLPLTLLWLSATVLYVQRLEWVVFVGMLIGGVQAYLATSRLGFPVTVAHVSGLATADLLLLASGYATLRRRERKETAQPGKGLGRRLTALETAPYFAWGAAYFTLIFADRIVAWTQLDGGLRFQFNAVYEVGLDWALFVLVLGIAALEGTVRHLFGNLKDRQIELDLKRIGTLDRVFPRFWLRRVGGILLLSAGTAVFAWFAIPGLVQLGGVSSSGLARLLGQQSTINVSPASGAGLLELPDFFAQPMVRFVAVVGMASYVLLTLGLLNSTFLLALAQPGLILVAALPAIAVDLVVGIVAHVVAGPEFSVCGLLAGSLVFVTLSLILTNRVMKRINYFSFAAF